MKFINTWDKLRTAHVYYVNADHHCSWLEVYKRVLDQPWNPGTALTVKEVARFLLDQPKYCGKIADRIRELSDHFQFQYYWVETCPTPDGSSLYLRGGNKRSIAYAMRILSGLEKFQPIPVQDWQPEFTELDGEELRGLPPIYDPIIPMVQNPHSTRRVELVEWNTERSTMDQIAYDDFAKVDMRVGRIVKVEDLPEARKPMYKMTIDFGPELGTKQSCGQYTQNYTKEELMNRLVLGVVNFPPCQIGPALSEVLTLGVSDEHNNAVLVEPEREVALGTRMY